MSRLSPLLLIDRPLNIKLVFEANNVYAKSKQRSRLSRLTSVEGNNYGPN